MHPRACVLLFLSVLAICKCSSRPTDPPWPSSLDKYEKSVNETMVEEMRQYANSKLANHEAAIKLNLQRLVQPVSLDLLWPGSSFGAVACGGQLEVLSLLEQRGLLKIGNVMGASGGATSAAFALADNSSSRTLLRSYDVSAQYLKDHPEYFGTVLIEQPAFFHGQYMYALQSAESFARAKERGYISLTARKPSSWGSNSQWVLNNFTSTQQFADAVFASGEASAKGALAGDSIAHLADRLVHAEDGGSLAEFPNAAGPAVYYHTIFAFKYLVTITPDTIRYLYTRGVDDTIQMLLSKDFLVTKDSSGYGGMAMALNGTSAELKAKGWSVAQDPSYLDVGKGLSTG